MWPGWEQTENWTLATSIEKILIDSQSYSGPVNIFFRLFHAVWVSRMSIKCICYISPGKKPLPETTWCISSEFWTGEETLSDVFLLYTYILTARNSYEINKGHLELSSVLCLNRDGQNCIYCNFDTILSRN